MNAPSKVDPTGRWPEGEVATATDFVRHFGHYAATSQSKPVYIAQHGRVGWALLSAAQMTRLAVAEGETAATDARFDILLDSISSIVLLTDEQLRITRMNRAARRHFQVAEISENTGSLWTLLHENDRDYLTQVCTRVLNSGDSETFDLESARYPGRTLHFQAMPFPSGLAILADVVTQATRSRQSSSAAAAVDLAIDAATALGRGRVDVRGAITGLNGNLSSMIQGRSEDVLGLRLPVLFDSGARGVVHDALDNLLTSGNAFSVEAHVLNGTATPVPVTVGAAAERDGGSIAGAAFIVMRRG